MGCETDRVGSGHTTSTSAAASLLTSSAQLCSRSWHRAPGADPSPVSMPHRELPILTPFSPKDRRECSGQCCPHSCAVQGKSRHLSTSGSPSWSRPLGASDSTLSEKILLWRSYQRTLCLTQDQKMFCLFYSERFILLALTVSSLILLSSSFSAFHLIPQSHNASSHL